MSESVAESIPSTEPLIIGRYALFDEIAAGGMAKVHLGRLLGSVSFGRTVAIKRLHAHFLADPEFITMFMDEARVAARIRHPNVVGMVDVVQSSEGLLLVMDYVHGESYSRLLRTARAQKQPMPWKITTAIVYGVLLGLHAAHETRGPDGKLLGVVHRDVSPQNVIVGADGVPRVLDFGIAKAAGRAQITREGQIKGKLAYMAPEQVRGQVDRRTDIFSISVCLWEALAGQRLHEGLKDVEIITRVMRGTFTPPSVLNPEVPAALDAIVLRGLSPDPERRFTTAREMAIEIEKTVGLASTSEVASVVEQLAQDVLRARSEKVDNVERASASLLAKDSNPPSSPATAAPPPPISSTPGLDSPFTATTSAAAVTDVVPPPPQRMSMAMIVAISFSALFALAGVSFGTYAILHKRGSAARRNLVTPTAIAPPRAGSSAPSASSPQPLLSADPGALQAVPSASAAASTASSARAVGQPGPRPAFTPPSKPAETARKGCDPPYTIDENGHRHYKPDCFDTF